MKNLVFILLLSISVAAHSQTQKETSKNDSLPSLKKESLLSDDKLEFSKKPTLNERLNNYLDNDADNKNSNSFTSKIASPEPLNKKDDIKKPVDKSLQPLDIYLGPPLETNTFTRYPFANDYTFSSAKRLSDQLWLTGLSTQNTYPTSGAVRAVGLDLNYQPLDWLIISGGPYGAKYNLQSSTNLGRNGNFNPTFTMDAFNDVGAQGRIKFILHDRIRLNGYGQYSVNGDRNGIQGPMMNMYPQTFYGGSLEIKITEKFGVEGGVIRELNPFNGKWVNRTYFAPVFYTR